MNVKKAHKDLFEMLEELKSAPKIYSPSIYWENINQFHIKHITNCGINYFKRSLNREYFEWGISEFRHQLSPIRSELRRANLWPLIKSELIDKETRYVTSTDQFAKLVARFLKTSRFIFFAINDNWFRPFNKLESLAKLFYKIYVAYLYDYVSRIDHFGLFKKFSEPRVGGPLLVKYRRKFISQDLCNSVHEFYSITGGIKINDNLEIGELGAGYGRLAYVFLKALPKVNYCIIDIPPALYVAQEYLRKTLPREKIFSFRTFKNFKRIEKEFQNSRIKFLMPHQLEYLPNNFFDIMINISSFQEMRRDQIKNYLQQADRLTRGFFYSKQWKKSKTPDNNFIAENEYPIPRGWREIYRHTHPIQQLFFEALYKTRNGKG